MPAKASPHAGHRARLRARFREAGERALADHELLELALFFALPRRDVKPLAKALLARFGSLAAVLGASPAAVAALEGSGAHVGDLLGVVHAMAVRAGRRETLNRSVFDSWGALISYCERAFAHAEIEALHVVYLNARNEVLDDQTLTRGTIDATPLYPREILRGALARNATGVVVVHNHPSGSPEPSREDVEATRALVAAAQGVGVQVHDHIIVSPNGATSFRELGLL